MEREEILAAIDEIGTCEDEADRRTKLNSMRDSVAKLFDQNAELAANNTKLGEANEKLRSANTDLFLQLGSQRNPEPPQDPKPQAKELTYENLFNEKGRLK